MSESPVSTCLNCQQQLSGKFCSFCGQEVKEIRRPFFYLIKDALSSVFELDSRALRTVYFLFTRPGFLSRQYVVGKRVSFTPPLRLFLVISISFFLLVSAFTSLQSLRASIAGDEESEQTVESPLIIANVDVDVDSGEGEGEVDDMEDLIALIDGFGIPFLSEQRNENLRNYMRSQARSNLNEIQENPEDFFYGSLDYITIFMLLMMPILAVIQKILYWRSKRFYVEHLILTLHNHAFLILAIFLANMAAFVEGRNIAFLSTLFSFIATAITIWIVVYLYLSLRNFFQQGHLLTSIKFIAIAISYSIVVGIGIFYFAAILFFLF